MYQQQNQLRTKFIANLETELRGINDELIPYYLFLEKITQYVVDIYFLTT